MVELLPDHTHCLQCDAAIPLGKAFCGEECEKVHRRNAKKSNQRTTLMVVIVVVAIAAATILTLMR